MTRFIKQNTAWHQKYQGPKNGYAANIKYRKIRQNAKYMYLSQTLAYMYIIIHVYAHVCHHLDDHWPHLHIICNITCCKSIHSFMFMYSLESRYILSSIQTYGYIHVYETTGLWNVQPVQLYRGSHTKWGPHIIARGPHKIVYKKFWGEARLWVTCMLRREILCLSSDRYSIENEPQ